MLLHVCLKFNEAYYNRLTIYMSITHFSCILTPLVINFCKMCLRTRRLISLCELLLTLQVWNPSSHLKRCHNCCLHHAPVRGIKKPRLTEVALLDLFYREMVIIYIVKNYTSSVDILITININVFWKILYLVKFNVIMSTSLNHWNMQEHKTFAVMFSYAFLIYFHFSNRYYRLRDLTYYIILYYVILCYIILHYITFYYIILYYIILYYFCVQGWLHCWWNHCTNGWIRS